MSSPPEDLVKSTGAALRRLREGARLTQDELAARLQARGLAKGSTAKTVSAWELGGTPIPLAALPVIAGAFGLDIGALSRHLGLCGEAARRDIVIAEGADALQALADEPPEVAETILRWLRESIEIARSGRLARTN